MKYNFERIKVLITSACNSNCTHCFRHTEKNTKELSWEKLKEIVDFGVENNCELFSFSGGEFFTHLSAYDLIEYCVSKNVHISILTNALHMDIPFFENLKNRELLSFQISVDGLREKHDKRRGEGSFDRTMFNVKRLYDLGFSLSAKTALDENNYMDIAEILQMPWFSKVLILPVAFSAKERKDQYISDEYRKFERVIQLIYTTTAENKSNLCRCYPQELAIKYDGGIYPCTEAREHDEFLIGNINDKSLRVILDEYELDSERKFKCPKAYVEVCEQCPQCSACNHGCRLRALRFYGDLLGPDPFGCRVYKDENLDVPIGQLFWGEK